MIENTSEKMKIIIYCWSRRPKALDRHNGVPLGNGHYLGWE